MVPDFLLRCVTCGSESIWDTEACPPVGKPEIGHPVIWQCESCGGERRHIIQDLFVITDKLHHDICVATEFERSVVDRVMAQMYRYRKRTRETVPSGPPEPAEEVEEVLAAAGIPQDVVVEISVAEVAWMLQHGYFPEITLDT
jgi:hypothetical protein